MSVASDLLNALRVRGVHLEVAGGRLRVDAPAGLLTPADQDAIRTYRSELGALLTVPAEEVKPLGPAMELILQAAALGGHLRLDGRRVLMARVDREHPEYEEFAQAVRQHQRALTERLREQPDIWPSPFDPTPPPEPEEDDDCI